MDVAAHGRLGTVEDARDLGIVEVLVEPEYDGRPLAAGSPSQTRQTRSARLTRSAGSW